MLRRNAFSTYLRVGHGPVRDAQPDRQEDQPAQEQQVAPLAAKLGPDRGHLAAVRAPGQIVLQRVKLKQQQKNKFRE